MQTVTDWKALWRGLVEINAQHWKKDDSGHENDHWSKRALTFHQNVKRRWEKPDSSRNLVLPYFKPDSTVLDIGAGTGAWAILAAQRAHRVTAVDPSPSMIAVLRENLATEGINNVDVIQAAWPDVEVEPHDFTLCFHSMYGCADFEAYIDRVITVTRRTVFLMMRAPLPGSVMAEAAQHVWGHPNDSPNFVIAYNILLEKGIYPNVLMEDPCMWEPWTHPTLEAAFTEIKRRLGLEELTRHDSFLKDLLHHRLTWQDDHFVWPRGVRSALVYWDTQAYLVYGSRVRYP